MTAWQPPSVTVAAVIERGRKFLLVEELFDGQRVLNQPAGHLDPGESLEAACVREVLEETAHDFTPRKLVGVYRWFFVPKDVTYLRFFFSGEAGSFLPERKLDKGIVSLHWVAMEVVKDGRPRHCLPA